jgi:hypothetical protein
MQSPVGSLILDAETRSKKKPSKVHTSKADCGCEVTVSWFSEDSRTTKTVRCPEHEFVRQGDGR